MISVLVINFLPDVSGFSFRKYNASGIKPRQIPWHPVRSLSQMTQCIFKVKLLISFEISNTVQEELSVSCNILP